MESGRNRILLLVDLNNQPRCWCGDSELGLVWPRDQKVAMVSRGGNHMPQGILSTDIAIFVKEVKQVCYLARVSFSVSWHSLCVQYNLKAHPTSKLATKPIQGVIEYVSVVIQLNDFIFLALFVVHSLVSKRADRWLLNFSHTTPTHGFINCACSTLPCSTCLATLWRSLNLLNAHKPLNTNTDNDKLT